jgi:hypothetical protein
MVEHGSGPGSGARDNGLRCAGYVAVGDLDPRVADDLLETLRLEGIAAYVTPTPGTRGGMFEVQLPSIITDRLYADSDQAERASELLASAPREAQPHTHSEPQPQTQALVQTETESGAEIDFDKEWAGLLESLQANGGGSAEWSAQAGAGAESARTVAGLASDPATEDHFVPPPPPPLPRLRRVTILSLLAIVVGLVVIATDFDGGSLDWLALLAILGGGAALVWHVKDGPPTDSGWDDGAVL